MSATVQLPQVFLADFLAKAKQAKQRIWLQSMNFEAGEMMEQLEPVLAQKANEGIDVRLEIDWVSQRFVHGHLPLTPVLSQKKRKYNQELHRRNLEVRERLREHGVKIITVNKAGLISRVFPTFRQNHIKLYIIDETAGWVGGVNLLDRGFACQDFMVCYEKATEVKVLADQFVRVNLHRSPKNRAVQLNQSDTFLVDAGLIGKSIIYGRALQMITTAQEQVDFVSQFVPEGAVLKALLAASKRGVRVNIVTNHHDAHKRWSPAHRTAYRVFIQQIQSSPTLSFRHSADRVHAKLLIIDQTQALYGSHNFVDTGVLMGTEEIAVQTTNLDLLQQLIAFYQALK